MIAEADRERMRSARILAQGIPADHGREDGKQRCPRCGEAKTEDQYHRDKWGKPGHYCRACMIEYKRAWRLKRYGPPKPKAAYPCERCGNQPTRSPRSRCCQQCWDQLHPPSTEYSAVHRRLSKLRGSASELQCVDCGKQAVHWSWDRTGPALIQLWHGKIIRYTDDLSRYVPRCRSCHGRHDHPSHRRRLLPVVYEPATQVEVA
jgi:hypothetical protein